VQRFHFGPDGVAVVGAFDIVGARFDRGFEHLFLVARAGGIFDQAERSNPCDRARCAQIAAVLG
jgi:hypothetical protein